MATWETENAKANVVDPSATISGFTSERDAARASSGVLVTDSNKTGGFFDHESHNAGWTSEYSVVGIQVDAVDSMREAIRTWVSDIQTHLSGIEPTASAAQAFRSSDGQVEEAVRLYIENCKQYCMNLTSSLLAFSDKLADVRDAWVRSTGNLAGTITADTQATSAGTAYTETMQ